MEMCQEKSIHSDFLRMNEKKLTKFKIFGNG